MNELNLLYETSERIRDTPISIKDAPVNHVSKPALHYGKPFCSGSLILFTFIEIMETIKFSRELSSSMAAKILKHDRAENFIFKIS